MVNEFINISNKNKTFDIRAVYLSASQSIANSEINNKREVNRLHFDIYRYSLGRKILPSIYAQAFFVSWLILKLLKNTRNSTNTRTCPVLSASTRQRSFLSTLVVVASSKHAWGRPQHYFELSFLGSWNDSYSRQNYKKLDKQFIEKGAERINLNQIDKFHRFKWFALWLLSYYKITEASFFFRYCIRSIVL